MTEKYRHALDSATQFSLIQTPGHLKNPTMLKRNPSYHEALASLTPGYKTAFVLLSIGGIFPVLFLGIVHPIFWIVASQMACLSGLSYIRWRTPAFGGSIWVMIVSVIACITSFAAAVMS